jgi:phosphoglycerate transport regulatory protein PgtC
VIDFFGLSAIASGQPIDFAYPSLTSVVPASVAVVKNGPNPANARAFVEYLLGDEGQQRLFAPEIGCRWCPRSTRAPKGYPNPFTMKLGGVDFDDKLSSGRRNVVNALFDQVVTFRHAELKAAWGAIHTADAQVTKARVGGRNVEAALAQLAEAHKLASAVPLDARRASDREVNAAFKDKPEVKSRMETEWDTTAKAGYARARELAEGAAGKIR